MCFVRNHLLFRYVKRLHTGICHKTFISQLSPSCQSPLFLRSSGSFSHTAILFFHFCCMHIPDTVHLNTTAILYALIFQNFPNFFSKNPVFFICLSFLYRTWRRCLLCLMTESIFTQSKQASISVAGLFRRRYFCYGV